MTDQTNAAEPRVQRLTDRLTPWFAEGFNQHGQGEKITWELGMLTLPTEVRGQFTTVLTVFLAIPGAVPLTDVMSNAMIKGPSRLDREQVLDYCRGLVESTIQMRSGQLAEMERQAMHAAANGRPGPTNGFLAPNGESLNVGSGDIQDEAIRDWLHPSE